MHPTMCTALRALVASSPLSEYMCPVYVGRVLFAELSAMFNFLVHGYQVLQTFSVIVGMQWLLHIATACSCARSYLWRAVVGRGDNTGAFDENEGAARDRDRRRRTNVLMEDVHDADFCSTVHFLTPELAARSALFRG